MRCEKEEGDRGSEEKVPRSAEMGVLFMKCLAYEANQRYQSASEVGDALRHALKQSS